MLVTLPNYGAKLWNTLTQDLKHYEKIESQTFMIIEIKVKQLL